MSPEDEKADLGEKIGYWPVGMMWHIQTGWPFSNLIELKDSYQVIELLTGRQLVLKRDLEVYLRSS